MYDIAMHNGKNQNGQVVTDREICSIIEAYRHAPWGEDQKYDAAKGFLIKARSNPDGFVMEFRQAPDSEPYLYVHGVNYRDNIVALIENEFTGEHALWRTADKPVIEKALSDCASASYICNIHADKTVEIGPEYKPRLKVLPEIIEELFSTNHSSAVVLFTHRNTGVAAAVTQLAADLYAVKSVNYTAECNHAELNNSHAVDYLTLFIITKR